MNTSEILNKAADLIEERGHATGSGWPGSPEAEHGKLCLEGGIMAALGITWDEGHGFNALLRCPAYSAVESYLSDPEINPHQDAPFMWQDALPHGAGGWVGGSEEAARAHAKARVIEVLRAAALVEATKELSAPVTLTPEPSEARA